jgi:hypothetical protein
VILTSPWLRSWGYCIDRSTGCRDPCRQFRRIRLRRLPLKSRDSNCLAGWPEARLEHSLIARCETGLTVPFRLLRRRVVSHRVSPTRVVSVLRLGLGLLRRVTLLG